VKVYHPAEEFLPTIQKVIIHLFFWYKVIIHLICS